MVEAAHERAPSRVPEATRALVTVKPEPGFELQFESLGDQRSDVRVISVDPDTKAVVLDAPTADLAFLRKKLENYANPDKTNKKSQKPRHHDAIAPIAQLSLATVDDLAGPRFPSMGQVESKTWFELACRGGTRRDPTEAASTRAQLYRAMGDAPRHEFMATERLLVFLRLTPAELRELIIATDCVLEFDAAGPDVRDWLLMQDELGQPLDLNSFTAAPPPANAPEVVFLDTGIASTHPLLKDAIRAALSVAPDDNSPEDVHGHGTKTGGVCLYEDIGTEVTRGQTSHSHWIQSVKVLRMPGQGSASDEGRPFWPETTEKAVEAAEGVGPASRVFSMSITAPHDKPGTPTFWSHAVDQLAFNEGNGRLLCVSAGNADATDLALLAGYPQMNLRERLSDPAQAFNALTVGAVTFKTTLPPSADYAHFRPIAPLGGVSPYTRTGNRGQPIKPDVVFEGGNIAMDGAAPDHTVETLSDITTRRDWVAHPLTTMNATSLATAHASRFAARLLSIDPTLSPQLLRGLVVHSASWTDEAIQQFPNLDERLQSFGYGVPAFATASSCARDRATVVVEDRIPNVLLVVDPLRDPAHPDRIYRRREIKFFRLPIPDALLMNDPDLRAHLRVTLSYFAEPNTVRRSVYRGLDLAWDMQGPVESEEQFLRRVNKLMRDESAGPRTRSKGYDWDIGIQRRSRGTVQSDRWSGPASHLAGNRLIAVYPVIGGVVSLRL